MYTEQVGDLSEALSVFRRRSLELLKFAGQIWDCHCYLGNCLFCVKLSVYERGSKHQYQQHSVFQYLEVGS